MVKSRANSFGDRRSRSGDLPSAAELLAFIRESPSAVGKREIARAFAVAPGNRPELRDMLRNIERSGAVTRAANRRFVAAPPLPEVTVIERIGSDEDGLALARPVAWPGPEPAPILRISETGTNEALKVGERAAARLVPLETGDIEARIIRRLDSAGDRIIGTFQNTREGGRLVPADRRNRNEYRVAVRDTGGAGEGELVVAEQLAAGRLGAPRARVLERLGPASDPGAISLLAIAAYDIPTEFPAAALAEAEAAAELGGEHSPTRSSARAAPSALATICGRWLARARSWSCTPGSIRSTRAPVARQSVSTLPIASGVLRAEGVMITRRSLNSSGSAATAPVVSLPATGCAATSAIAGPSLGSSSRTTQAFTLPTSVTTASRAR